MDQCLDPATNAWEEIHGVHHVPKNYVPPFMAEEVKAARELAAETESPSNLKEKMYALEVEQEAVSQEPFQPPSDKKKQRPADLAQEQNLEDVPDFESGKRQISEMKFIRVRVKTLKVESDDLLQKINS
mmetsp:Transcript_34710/g.53253  ORF Transcript_34710/g.53253 Transcript_34710/m.53253 type:complete len:129 (+) Transcript_34710:970-1356(+)